MPSVHDLRPGQKYGRLTAFRFDHRDSHRRLYYWMFYCDCGKAVVRIGGRVLSGQSTSCGCWSVEKRTKHGHCPGHKMSREFNIWQHIKRRCNDQKRRDYKNYGGRGIKVCDRWLESFTNFLEDMGECPSGMSIERIDVDGHYEPSNCKWATLDEQANNKTNTHYLELNGKKMSIAQWARELGVKNVTIQNRLRYGWTIERTLTTPARPYGQNGGKI